MRRKQLAGTLLAVITGLVLGQGLLHWITNGEAGLLSPISALGVSAVLLVIMKKVTPTREDFIKDLEKNLSALHGRPVELVEVGDHYEVRAVQEEAS